MPESCVLASLAQHKKMESHFKNYLLAIVAQTSLPNWLLRYKKPIINSFSSKHANELIRLTLFLIANLINITCETIRWLVCINECSFWAVWYHSEELHAIMQNGLDSSFALVLTRDLFRILVIALFLISFFLVQGELTKAVPAFFYAHSAAE